MSGGHYRPADGVLADRVDGKAVLVDPAGREVLTLNPTGSAVWEAIAAAGSGGVTPDALVQRIVDEFEDADPGRARDDIARFLGELADLGLVMESDD